MSSGGRPPRQGIGGVIAEDHTGWDAVTRLPNAGGLGFDVTWHAEFYHGLIGDSDMAGDAATSSVGAYQLEGIGIHLFERIDGNFFTILGLPLLPLLDFLRRNNFLHG